MQINILSSPGADGNGGGGGGLGEGGGGGGLGGEADDWIHAAMNEGGTWRAHHFCDGLSWT